MENTITLKKRNLVLGVILAAVIMTAVFSFIPSIKASFGGGGPSGPGGLTYSLAMAGCPSRSGTCTGTETTCSEDHGGRFKYACQYTCSGGSWVAEKCGGNMCNGGECST